MVTTADVVVAMVEVVVLTIPVLETTRPTMTWGVENSWQIMQLFDGLYRWIYDRNWTNDDCEV